MQILRHFVVTAHISLTHVQSLLTMLHKAQAQIDYKALPKTVETLLRVPAFVKDGIIIKKFVKNVEKMVRGKKTTLLQEVGQQLHYGIKAAIEGTSAGIVEKWRYKKDLRLIDDMDPSFLTTPFKKFLSAETDGASGHDRDPICVHIDLFADGFNPYENCTKNYWNVSGIITSLQSGKRRLSMKCEFHYIRLYVFRGQGEYGEPNFVIKEFIMNVFVIIIQKNQMPNVDETEY